MAFIASYYCYSISMSVIRNRWSSLGAAGIEMDSNEEMLGLNAYPSGNGRRIKESKRNVSNA